MSTVLTEETSFRPRRTYVGTFAPWVEASVGPQFISAYVDTVLVRPGAMVKRRQVLATLDCRNASTTSQAIAAQARAIEARQHALADQSARMKVCSKARTFQRTRPSKNTDNAEAAQLAASQASLARSTLEVDDCVMRAPFDGEVTVRSGDPGAFVRPGMALLHIVDRSTLRFTVDVPEDDFDIVAPGTHVHVGTFATHTQLDAGHRSAHPCR